MSRPHTLLIEPGASVMWDGKPCTILYQGQPTTTLLTEDRRPLEVSHSHFQALVAQGKLVGQASPPERGSLSVQVRERMMNASHAALAEANRRYAIIQPVLEERALVDTTTPARTIRYWPDRYREEPQTLGLRYVALLSTPHQRSNHHPPIP